MTKLSLRERTTMMIQEIIDAATPLSDPNDPRYFWDAFPEIEKFETGGISFSNDEGGSSNYTKFYIYHRELGRLGDFVEADNSEDQEIIDSIIEKYKDVFDPILEAVDEFECYIKITREGIELNRDSYAIDYEYQY
jgi:hypothetical protein